LGAFDVEFTVAWTLPFLTLGTEVVRPLNGDGTERGKQMFGAHLVKARLLAARAWDGAFELIGRGQKMLEQLCSQLMSCIAGGHFDGFQVENAALASAGEDDFQ
jgi:hypothetical protein